MMGFALAALTLPARAADRVIRPTCWEENGQRCEVIRTDHELPMPLPSEATAPPPVEEPPMEGPPPVAQMRPWPSQNARGCRDGTTWLPT
jgi:hypothetical protein